ncbi:MAG TPA: hypothetical protein VIJ85_01855 [Rhizomicrobium sp.]
MKTSLIFCALLTASPALAQTADPFTDGKDGAKIHTASGFICPAKIGPFERDAASESDVLTGADLCSYAALDGVYGTITLTPLTGPYDAKAALAPAFTEQEGTGGTMISETTITLGAKTAPLAVFARTYRTAHAESLEYRTLFAGAQVKNWAVQATVEYADPRDTATEKDFLNAVYADAQKEIAQ